MNRSYFKKACLRRQGFTLIELLVVVGILAVLAIAALIAINPVEAQRRSRDSARLQDLARLTASFEALLNDTGSPFAANQELVSNAAANVGVRSQSCSTNWLTVDLCEYLKQVPLDPLNGRNTSIVPPGAGARVSANARYAFAYINASGDYKFCAYLEAERSRDILTDGGTQANFFETGSNVGLAALDCN